MTDSSYLGRSGRPQLLSSGTPPLTSDDSSLATTQWVRDVMSEIAKEKSVFVQKSSDQALVSNTPFGVIAWDSPVFDFSGGNWNSTTGIYTSDFTGIVRMTATGCNLTNLVGAMTSSFVGTRIDGSDEFISGWSSNAVNYVSRVGGFTQLIPVVPGTTLQLSTFSNFSAGTTILTAAYLQIMKEPFTL